MCLHTQKFIFFSPPTKQHHKIMTPITGSTRHRNTQAFIKRVAFLGIPVPWDFSPPSRCCHSTATTRSHKRGVQYLGLALVSSARPKPPCKHQPLTEASLPPKGLPWLLNCNYREGLKMCGLILLNLSICSTPECSRLINIIITSTEVEPGPLLPSDRE